MVLVSKIAKRSDKLSGLIAVLPMFLAFPLLLERVGFWWAISSIAITINVFYPIFTDY